MIVARKRVRMVPRKQVAQQSQPNLVEHPGRPIGSIAGSHIDDLAAQRLAIVLCWACMRKFGHKKYGYYKDRRFPFVQGKCDDCRNFSLRAAFYIHETFLGEANGRIKSGQCWTPV